MAACWGLVALCAVVALPTGSSLLSSWQCERREEADWADFGTAIKPSGLAEEDGVSSLAADLRTGALSMPVPHTYVIVGGGEWGPRVVAKAVLESVYVDWVNDVYLLDMKEAKSYLDQDSEPEKAQTWLNKHLCDAIARCPQKAVVVLDNVHVLQGEDIRLLDTMLSLLDGTKSNMECSGVKISGDRCLFLLLLNEDGSEETKRLSGKDRLLKTWEFRGLEFTTKAFVGRIDIAVSLSQTRHPPPDGMEADWSKARTLPKDGLIELAKKLVTPQAVGVVTAVGIAAVATWYTLGHCRKASSSSGGGDSGGGSRGGSGSQGDNNKKNGGKDGGHSGTQTALDVRAGGRNDVSIGGGGVATEGPGTSCGNTAGLKRGGENNGEPEIVEGDGSIPAASAPPELKRPNTRSQSLKHLVETGTPRSSAKDRMKRSSM